MADTRRGKKQNYTKNYVAHKEWVEGKKIGRRKQQWIDDTETPTGDFGQVITPVGHWEKI